MSLIFHIVSKSDWKATSGLKEYLPTSLTSEGFIHCSKPDQLLYVAEAFFTKREDLLILKIREEKVAAPIKHEPPFEAPMSGLLFPHIYGPLNLDAIEAVIEFPLPPSGKFELPADLLK